MNVETMEMDTDEARLRYIEYRRSVRQHREERRRRAAAEADEVHARRTAIEREEEELRAAYRAMSLGQRVLCLPRVMRAAGFDAQGLPKLAIACSQWSWVNYDSSKASFRPDGVRRGGIEFAWPEARDVGWRRARALVPPVPPRFRPDDLEKYHTLWEPVWQPVPPKDPILLRQISDSMYVVVAQWDLSPIERAVLEGRFAQ